MIKWICTLYFSVTLFDLVLSKGHVSLDTHNFDKILSKFHTTLVKFDIAYPYGAKHEAFLEVAESSKHQPDFLVAEVGVKDYGERDNEDLAKRYSDSLNKTLFILIIFFSSIGIWIGAVGCLQDFDRLAKDFIRSASQERKTLLKSAEDLWDEIKTNSARKSAEFYVKTMRKLVEISGEGSESEFLTREKARLKGLLNQKVSAQKKDELKSRMNILDSFALYVKSSGGRDEL
ncbi:endoplasmic reticulum resident protein 29 [Diaphorina citri]|uniref:Endoplasmic reticulum resident protein 29 n=1 Tax=Diaphorina citri TaxID=121845 RepID=A0A3Q0J5D9_DIACI|nr:endoplasmic reticulum resident protein 29 [Diaphorina citri]